jgi:hypothetical protein
VLIRHLWQLKTVVFLNLCLICIVLLTANVRQGWRRLEVTNTLAYYAADLLMGVKGLWSWPLDLKTLKHIHSVFKNSRFSLKIVSAYWDKSAARFFRQVAVCVLRYVLLLLFNEKSQNC